MAEVDGFVLGGHNDWRIPTIKEMCSLMDFRGFDPGGCNDEDLTGMILSIDQAFPDFAWGNTEAGERIIDSQML